MLALSITQAAVLIFVFLALVAGHYFPWHVAKELVDKDKKLRLLYRYAYGIVCIFLGFITIRPRDFDEAVVVLAIVIVAAGLGTKFAYHIDWVLDKGADDNDSDDRQE